MCLFLKVYNFKIELFLIHYINIIKVLIVYQESVRKR